MHESVNDSHKEMPNLWGLEEDFDENEKPYGDLTTSGYVRYSYCVYGKMCRMQSQLNGRDAVTSEA